MIEGCDDRSDRLCFVALAVQLRVDRRESMVCLDVATADAMVMVNIIFVGVSSTVRK